MDFQENQEKERGLAARLWIIVNATYISTRAESFETFWLARGH